MTPQESPGDVSRARPLRRSTAVHGFPRPVAATSTIPVGKLDEDVFERASASDGSSIRGWQAINESDMLLLAPAGHRGRRSVHADPDAQHDLQRAGTPSLFCEDYTRDPRNGRTQGPSLPEEHRRGRTRATSAPRLSSSSSTTFGFYQTPNNGFYYSRQHRRPMEPWHRLHRPRAKGRTSATATPQGGYFPVPPSDQLMDIPQRDDADDDRVRTGRRGPAP